MRANLSAYMVLIAASIGYGSLSVIAKYAYVDGVSSGMLAVSQFVWGLILFSAWRLRDIQSFFRLEKKTIFFLSIPAISSSLTAYFYYQSLHLLLASIAVILLFQFVWMGIVLELIYRRRIPKKDEISALLLCGVGTFLAADVLHAPWHSLGMSGFIYGILSAVCFAVYVFSSAVCCTKSPAQARAFWVIAISCLCILCVNIGDYQDAHIGATLFWGVICGAVGVVLPFFAYSYAAPKIGAAATSLIGSVELPSALVLSYLFLAERLSGWQLVGIVCVLLAPFILFIGERRR